MRQNRYWEARNDCDSALLKYRNLNKEKAVKKFIEYATRSFRDTNKRMKREAGNPGFCEDGTTLSLEEEDHNEA